MPPQKGLKTGSSLFPFPGADATGLLDAARKRAQNNFVVVSFRFPGADATGLLDAARKRAETCCTLFALALAPSSLPVPVPARMHGVRITICRRFAALSFGGLVGVSAFENLVGIAGLEAFADVFATNL